MTGAVRPGNPSVRWWLLSVHAWTAGRAARLRGWHLLASTSVAAGIGLVMILLKDLVLIHLH